MSSRLIQQCIDEEGLEIVPRELYIRVPADTICLVVDPFAIDIKDLINMKPGRVSIVRIRRPMWGQGNIHKYIHIIGGA